jgi:hypothetical protein
MHPNARATGKAYKEQGITQRAAHGAAWHRLYKTHAKNNTVPNEEAFAFAMVRTSNPSTITAVSRSSSRSNTHVCGHACMAVLAVLRDVRHDNRPVVACNSYQQHDHKSAHPKQQLLPPLLMSMPACRRATT